jgi:hypothetical protein
LARIAVARFINPPDALAALGYPLPWDRDHFLAVLRARLDSGLQVFGSAYKVGTAGQRIYTLDYVADILDRLWESRKVLRPRAGERLAEWCGSSNNVKVSHGSWPRKL